MVKCPSCGTPKAAADDPCDRCAELPTSSLSASERTTDHFPRTAEALERTGAAFGESDEELAETSDDLRSLLEAEERRAATRPVARPSAFSDPSAGTVTVDIRPRLEFDAVPANADPIIRLLVDITPEGPPLLDPRAGPVAHVILLLDLSASMNHPDKYPVLTEALNGMLHHLTAPGSPEVLLSVVVFAHGAKTLFRDVPASTLTPRDVLEKIDASPWRFGRYTDMAGALKRAGRISKEQLQKQREMPVRVYVLTDGMPQDVARTRRIMAKIAKMPVDIDALAFGADADVVLLQQFISGCRGGTVKHVRDDTLAEAFDRIAETARRVVSDRAIVDFELAPGVIGGMAYRYRPGRHRFGDDAFAAGTRFHTDLGTVESGRTYSFLFEVRMPETIADRTDVGYLRLQLRGPGPARVFEAVVSVPRTSGMDLPAPDPAVVAAADVLAALTGSDTKTQLSALRIRRKLYETERRDPHVIAVIDKAIAALEEAGTLAALSPADWATLRSHTCTAGGPGPFPSRREFATG